MKRVIIPRSIPGGGKSTYLKSHFPDATVASADHYFIGGDGVYRFNMRDIGKAHKACQDTFDAALARGDETVVVDNTNIKPRDFKRYVDAARAAGYTVEIIRLECVAEVAHARGKHGVPLDIVRRMAKDLVESKLPPDYPLETVVKTD